MDNMEWVLLVPPPLAQSSYKILVQADCVPRAWHFEGRFGSRTHKHVDDDAAPTTNNATAASSNDKPSSTKKNIKIAIPIISKSVVMEAAANTNETAKLTMEDPTTITAANDKVIKEDLINKKETMLALQKLLATDGVECAWTESIESNRAIRELPYFDAKIHPEQAPTGYGITTAIVADTTNTDSSTTAAANTSEDTKNNLPFFTYMDLFAGIGGFAVALDALGGECILASEIDAPCQRVYRHNFPSAPLHGDVTKIDGSTVQQKEDDTVQKDGPPPVDLLVGGFPCQPFSALGDQPGLGCQKGNLFLEIVRLLNIYKPQAFILENVPGLLALDETFQVIRKALEEDAGYIVAYEVCNARGLTATSRKRLFLVGLRKPATLDNGEDPSSATTPLPFEFPFVPDLQFKASDVLDYSNEELSDMERKALPLLDQQIQHLSKSKRWKPADLAWPNKVCDTLVSHYGNAITRGESQLVPCSAAAAVNNSNNNHINNNPRRFSPRECLRIMGFPNSYQLPQRPPDSHQGDMAFCKEQYRMAGNAVCPPLIAALSGAVLDRILTSKPQHQQSWVERGRHVAIDLAYAATRTGRPKVPADGQAISDGKDKQGTKRGFDSTN